MGEGVIDNIRAWSEGREKLDVFALGDELGRRYGPDGPTNYMARLLLGYEQAVERFAAAEQRAEQAERVNKELEQRLDETWGELTRCSKNLGKMASRIRELREALLEASEELDVAGSQVAASNAHQAAIRDER